MEPDRELPEELVQALKDGAKSPALITARVDREIEALAAEHFSGRRQRRTWPTWAAAASVLLAITLFYGNFDHLPAPPAVELYTDIDASGTIDIADVLAAAESGQPFTQDELDAFAMSLVTLGEDAS